MDISLASDHAGFEQKQQIKEHLIAQGHQVVDRGPASAERVDYPDFAAKVAADIARGTADFGVLICGTGIGMAIAANKHAGVRAANVTNQQFARLAREHNDANVVSLSARFVDIRANELIVDAFIATPFAGGRHADRVSKIEPLGDDPRF